MMFLSMGELGVEIFQVILEKVGNRVPCSVSYVTCVRNCACEICLQNKGVLRIRVLLLRAPWPRCPAGHHWKSKDVKQKPWLACVRFFQMFLLKK